MGNMSPFHLSVASSRCQPDATTSSDTQETKNVSFSSVNGKMKSKKSDKMLGVVMIHLTGDFWIIIIKNIRLCAQVIYVLQVNTKQIQIYKPDIYGQIGSHQ